MNYIEMFLLSLVATYWITCMYVMILVLLENKIKITAVNKMQCYGVRNIEMSWFVSNLSNRTEKVDYNGTSSSAREIVAGVIQVSTTGSPLFMMYIVSNNLVFILYAGDTTLSSPLC